MTVAGPEVRIASGVVRGRSAVDGLAVFRGIPFAQPPVGALLTGACWTKSLPCIGCGRTSLASAVTHSGPHCAGSRPAQGGPNYTPSLAADVATPLAARFGAVLTVAGLGTVITYDPFYLL